MKNLEQIRAAAAAAALPHGVHEHSFERADVAKIPALIIQNGLLAAAAFCCEEGKSARDGMRAAFHAIAAHLTDRGMLRNAHSGRALIDQLSKASSPDLQRATAEALAFVSYLKRFARPGN